MIQRKKGLGRGLDALLAGNDDAIESDKQRQATLAIGDLQPGKYQPRTRMDPGSLEDLAASIIKPGISGEVVHQAVVDFFASRGYGTKGEGYIHSLGHGVGLEVHELPSLGRGGDRLIRGHVVTNEPGLYYEKVGGIRLENIGLVTQTGFRTITKFPCELVI